MRALVTGGAGFIGSALVDRLVGDGHEVVVLDDLSSGNLENLADALATGKVDHAEADLAGPELPGVVARAKPEVVFHLAAQIDVRHSVADPVGDARVNVLGSIALAKSAADHGVRRLVFAASAGTAYGEPDPADLPVDEEYPPRATNPYGVAKRTVEDYLDTFHDLYGLESVSLRLGNVYGPRQDPHGEAGVVAIFCTRLLTGEPVVVYGDGTQTRDYVYVDDVAEAFLAAASQPQAVRQRLNIATGVETSVLELYAALREVTGFGPEPTFATARPGELQRIGLDVRRAKEVLGWRAAVDLPTGLSRTWAWAFQQINAGSVGG
jgi:UDP-glucose 4-epimerase